MEALFGATGLSINLGKEDNQKTESNDYTAKCIVNEYKNPKIFLYIVDKVEKNDGFEESGFHMQCWPPNVSARNSTKIFVYLSKERWEELTTDYDQEVGGSFFGTRCKYDRCHLTYRDD